MVHTFKGVGLYGEIFLHVGAMVNAPLCNSLYLFLSFLCHPYIITILQKFYYLYIGVICNVFKYWNCKAQNIHEYIFLQMPTVSPNL